MPQMIIYLDEKLNKDVNKFSKKRQIAKNDGVLRLIKLGLNVKGK